MNATKFLNFNQQRLCPSCGEPLKLYLQLNNSICFKAQFPLQPDTQELVFKQFKCKDDYIGEGDIRYVLNESKLIVDNGVLINKLLNSNFFLFFLCNELGFNYKKSYGKNRDNTDFDDYDIALYNGCYYRSSLLFKTNSTNNGLYFEPAINENKRIINQEEDFCFRKTTNDVEKIYYLSLDYLNNKTNIYYYTCDEKQQNDSNYVPNIFEKQLPILKKRPKFESKDRDQLLLRLDNWILLS